MVSNGNRQGGTCQREGQFVLTENIDLRLSETCLFYPGSGRDLELPIASFLPYLASFWFVDINYPAAAISKMGALEEPRAVFGASRFARYDGPAADMGGRRARFEQEPFVQTLECSVRESGQRFTIHWCGHDGPAVLRLLTEPVGVFFYRGDGDGEGGSSIPWLSNRRGGLNGDPGQMHEVLARLVDGGLIVTDGSNTFGERGSQSYEELGRFYLKRDKDPRSASREVSAFEDREGNRFRCVGYIERDAFGKGPTLVWQVRKPAPSL